MLNTEYLDDNRVRQIAEEEGTPIYVYTKHHIQNSYETLACATKPATLFYSIKANPNKDVCAVLSSLGCQAEVASIGELKTALEAGFDASKVLYIGPGKTDADIRDSYAAGIRRYVVDSRHEVERLASLTDVKKIYLRINPAFEADGGKLTMSGAQPKQFGVDRSDVKAFIDYAHTLGIRVTGLHYYLGTRFLRAEQVIRNTGKILEDALSILEETSIDLEFLDFGGGFGIAYFNKEVDILEDALVCGLQNVMSRARLKLPNTEFCFESGRFLTAKAGSLILSVVAAKESYGVQYLICDGGTNLNMAAIGTGSIGKRNFPYRIVSRYPSNAKTDLEQEKTTNVTGPLCTPDDLLLKSIKYPTVDTPGDYIVLERVGAYGPTASPHSFLGHSYPREKLID